MLFHHVVTVILLGMSFAVNGVQIATLILLAHDISDVPLEVNSMMFYEYDTHHLLSLSLQLAKLLKYMKYDRCAQIAFGIFAFLFFVARLIIYPFYLLWSVLLEYPVVISHSPAWWIMVLLLCVLQV
jgi:ceramide synthetase